VLPSSGISIRCWSSVSAMVPRLKNSLVSFAEYAMFVSPYIVIFFCFAVGYDFA